MGKRDRRRKRQRAAATKTAAVQRVLYPSAGLPLLEVHITPGTPADVADMCRRYWEFTQPGQWACHVSAIGSTSLVYKAVRGACRAELLTVVCPRCATPVTVTSRSDLAATVVWGPDFPTEPVDAAAPCKDCAAAEATARQEEAERAKKKQQERDELLVANAGAWLREQADRAFPEQTPATLHALALLSVIDIMTRKGVEAIGPLDSLGYTITGSESGDVDVIRDLHTARYLCPTWPATVADFAFNDDDTVRGVYITQIPWRLAPSLGGKTSARREVSSLMIWNLLRQVDEVKQRVRQVEAGMAVDYLEGLLTRKYNEQPIPEHRLPDAYEMFLNALKEGFTLGQLVAVAWSSAAGAVAWGQRTPGLKAGSVSAAAVTNLERRIGYARDRRMDEYDLPNWVPRPAIHATALRVLEQHESEVEALSRFRTFRQRTESRPLEAAEFDGDMADNSQDDDWPALGGPDFMERLRAGAPTEEEEPAITYALIAPGGELEFHTDPASSMRDKVSIAGSGFVDRIILPEPSTVHAYVAEMVTASAEAANPIADEMLRLLDCYDGPFYGPISFFAVGRPKSRPQGLDENQQEMLRAAYEVARSRVGSS